MKKKVLAFLSALCLMAVCASALTACTLGEEEEKADGTLYRLTLSANMTLTDEQKAQLKATYGYGEPSATVKEGVRDEEDIAELKDAGATDEDIAKAGVRQSDGTYFFFDQDPIYLEAPAIEGYKLLGFYDKADGRLLINPILQDIDGGMYLPRYNMDAKNVEIEARYEKWTYAVSFDFMEEGDSNPNTLENYCFIDDPAQRLAPASTANTHKTFVGWAYQNTASYTGTAADWVMLEKDGENFKLPSTYYEEYMRITAVWDVDQYTVSFAFEKDGAAVDFDAACASLSVKGNLATLDGVPVKCDAPEDRTPVGKNAVLKIEYGSWLEIYMTPDSQFAVVGYQVGDGPRQTFSGYISLYEGDVTENTTVKFFVEPV